MLTPPPGTRAPERVLAFGGPGVGKSCLWIDIAQKMFEGGNPGKVYVIDTDNAVEAMFGEGYAHLEEIVQFWDCADWADLSGASKEIRALKPTIDDWVVIDLLSHPYTEVRRHYTEVIYGQDLEEYLIETARMVNMAKQAKARGEKDGRSEREFGDWSGQDWDHMGKIYRHWEIPLTLRMKANVLATAEERELNEQRGATAEQVKKYTRTGKHKPYVEKTAEHRFRTVMRVTSPGIGNRELILAKDRYREEAWDEKGKRGGVLPIGDMHGDGGFVRSYLLGIAGWEFTPKATARSATRVGQPTRGKAAVR